MIKHIQIQLFSYILCKTNKSLKLIFVSITIDAFFIFNSMNATDTGNENTIPWFSRRNKFIWDNWAGKFAFSFLNILMRNHYRTIRIVQIHNFLQPNRHCYLPKSRIQCLFASKTPIKTLLLSTDWSLFSPSKIVYISFRGSHKGASRIAEREFLYILRNWQLFLDPRPENFFHDWREISAMRIILFSQAALRHRE